MPQGNVTGDLRPRFSVTPDGHRHKALKRRRAFQRNHARWRPWRAECALGRIVADRAEAGRARPYELGDVVYALRQVASRRAVDALAWLLACERGFGGKRGAVVQHPDMARMLGCCARTAGAAMRELVELGLVEQRPHFVPRDNPADHAAPEDASRTRGWYERTPAYETTSLCKDVVARRDVRLARRKKRGSFLVGKNCQPPESAANPPGSQKSGVRARRPEQAFAESVLETRKPKKASALTAVFRVSGEQPTGLVDRREAAARRLLAEGLARPRYSGKSSLDDDITSLWASWTERNGGGGAAS